MIVLTLEPWFFGSMLVVALAGAGKAWIDFRAEMKTCRYMQRFGFYTSHGQVFTRFVDNCEQIIERAHVRGTKWQVRTVFRGPLILEQWNPGLEFDTLDAALVYAEVENWGADTPRRSAIWKPA